MVLLGVVGAIAAFAIVVFALNKKLDVKLGLKMPFVAFTFEAKDHDNPISK